MSSKSRTIALIIWLCEGTKARQHKRFKNTYYCPIEVINSDPKIIKIFADFLRKEMKVSNIRLKGQIQVHAGDNREEIEKFWAKETGIPRCQFNKTIIRPKGNKPNKNKGTFKLRLYDKNLFLKLKNLLELELKLINYGA
ncbi:hypothetical protein HY041_01590 [Candidatus Roizmanbacteria bacterium]|nr:hypothetical protein [Candidatus Roizmanbacteria bacterium]